LNPQNISAKIRETLTEVLAADRVIIQDDTEKHKGHKGPGLSQGGHYTVLIVSDQFKDKSPLKRHRMVYEALSEELSSHIHALSIQALTAQEWAQKE